MDTGSLDTLLRAEFGTGYENLAGTLMAGKSGGYGKRGLSRIKFVVLHHTAAPRRTTWPAVARYHVSGNGWPGIGYHVGVRDYGAECRVSLLNTPETRSYHAHANGNDGGIAVCVAGNFGLDAPTAREADALRRIAVVLRRWATWVDWLPVVAHGDVPGNETDCPGAHLADLLPVLNKRGDDMIHDMRLRRAIWDAAQGGQVVAVNPDSAIARVMAAQGYYAIGNERDVIVDGEWIGVAQLGYAPGGSASGVAFYASNRDGAWSVSVVEAE